MFEFQTVNFLDLTDVILEGRVIDYDSEGSFCFFLCDASDMPILYIMSVYLLVITATFYRAISASVSFRSV